MTRKKVLFAFAATAMLGGAVVPVCPAHAATTVLTTTLAGPVETPPGDPDGTGAFSVEVDADAGDFCYSLSAARIARATMAHVHSGAAGASGPPVITLELGNDLCVAVEPELLKQILAAPQNYYVNVHNAEYPGGAVRGQLARK
jgi:hypothetical protein